MEPSVAPIEDDPIATVDLGLLVDPAAASTEAHARELAKLRTACRTAGVFRLANHGMDEVTIRRVVSAFDRFFELPLEERMEIAVGPGEVYGYEPFDPRVRDVNDSFNCLYGLESLVRDGWAPPMGTNRWPRRPAELERDLGDAVVAFHGVGLRVLAAIAASLGLPGAYFQPFVGPEGVASVRARRYPPQPPREGRIGAGAHVDGPPLTLIVQNDVVGLESHVEGRGWSAVRPVPGTIVCQLGSLFARWTNDRYVANHHRVRNLDPMRERRSVVYWFPFRADAVVSCLPTCRDDGAPERYPPVRVLEYILDWASRLEHGDDDPRTPTRTEPA